MTGPKHLWSGDWENESSGADEEFMTRPAPSPDAEPIAPAPREPRRRERRKVPTTWLRTTRRALPIALAALIVFVAVALGVDALAGSSKPATQKTAAITSPRPVQWLGMEIETVSGNAVIETVGLGSPGEVAGLEPGDVIDQVNNHSITDTGDIGVAIRGLHKGDVVKIQVRNGTTPYETGITLAAPPAAYP